MFSEHFSVRRSVGTHPSAHCVMPPRCRVAACLCCSADVPHGNGPTSRLKVTPGALSQCPSQWDLFDRPENSSRLPHLSADPPPARHRRQALRSLSLSHSVTGAEGHPGVRRSPAPAVVLSQGGALRWEIGPDQGSKTPFCVVITRAAVRIFRSSTSTCGGGVIGNQAAAACSRAYARTRSAHYRSHHAPYSVSFRWLGFHDGSYGIQ